MPETAQVIKTETETETVEDDVIDHIHHQEGDLMIEEEIIGTIDEIEEMIEEETIEKTTEDVMTEEIEMIDETVIETETTEETVIEIETIEEIVTDIVMTETEMTEKIDTVTIEMMIEIEIDHRETPLLLEEAITVDLLLQITREKETTRHLMMEISNELKTPHLTTKSPLNNNLSEKMVNLIIM